MSFGAYIVDNESEIYDDDEYYENDDLGYLGKNKPPKKPKKKAIKTPKSSKAKTTRPRIVPIGKSSPLPADTPPIFETGNNTTKIDVQNTPPIIPSIEINNNSTTKSGGGSWFDKLLREGRSMFDQYVGGGRRQEIDAGGNIVRSGGGRGDVDASIGAGLDFDANEKGLGIGGKLNVSTWLMIGGGALFLVFLLGMMRKSKSR